MTTFARLATFATTLLVLLAVCPSARSAPRRVGTAAATVPGAEYRVASRRQWSAIHSGVTLTAGSSVRTGEHPVSLTLDDGATVELAKRSRIVLRDPTQVDVRGGPPAPAHRLDLEQGEMSFDLPQGKSRLLFVVHTNEILGVFSHGTARTRVVDEGMLAVVERGKANVASHGRWIELAAGHYAVLGARGAKAGPQRLAPAPQLDPRPCRAEAGKPCRIGVVQARRATALALRWRPVAGVRAYLVRIARDAQMGRVVSETLVPAPRAEHVTSPLTAGRYWATIQPVGADGVAGVRSEPAPMRVVGLALDKGARFDPRSRLVVLPDGLMLRFDDPGGLVQRVSDAQVPLPAALGLTRNQHSRVVDIALGGSTADSVQLRVEPRQVRADVDISPMTARWPKDPVVIRVRVQDPTGLYAADDVGVQIAVTVNLQEAELAFEREGDAWEATLEPRVGAGPWVVRVNVTDEEGRLLGRNFLEVIGTGG